MERVPGKKPKDKDVPDRNPQKNGASKCRHNVNIFLVSRFLALCSVHKEDPTVVVTPEHPKPARQGLARCPPSNPITTLCTATRTTSTGLDES